MANLIRILLFSAILFTSSCGTLGGFDSVRFSVGKTVLVSAIDSLYKENPQYKIPPDWKHFDNWSARGYDFLDSRIFYFDRDLKEMYYVTFIGDSATQASVTNCEIGIRAICYGSGKWYTEKQLNKRERERIQNRFQQEIISKLERYTRGKAY